MIMKDHWMNNTLSLRIFFAIEIDSGSAAVLEQVIKILRNHYPAEKITWTKTVNLHITLLFIGPTAAEKIPKLVAKVRKKTATLSAFTLSLEGIDFFPAPHMHAIVVKVMLPHELQLLVTALETVAITCGYQPEQRPFQPHITLGRFSHHPPLLPEIALKLPSTLIVNSIVLFKSESSANGIIYTSLENFPLGQAVGI
jgi:2'-5' RNA ligase